MKQIIFFSLLICSGAFAQVGIGTTNPKGALDVNSQFMGMSIPQVLALDDVVTPSGGQPVDGTIVYALDRESFCFRIEGEWICINDKAACDVDAFTPTYTNCSTYTYVKASNTDSIDSFGRSTDVNEDGSVVVIGATHEDSVSNVVNGNQGNNGSDAGAVYVYEKTNSTWSQTTYLKPSNSNSGDQFGAYVAVSGDGNVIAVSSIREDSSSNTINSNASDNSGYFRGAVYIFNRSGASWVQTNYIKPSASNNSFEFGTNIKLNYDGTTLAVGSYKDGTDAIGINGTVTNLTAKPLSGAVYIFTLTNGNWIQEAYIKANYPDSYDYFGISLDLNADGNHLVVGASNEASASLGIGGNQQDNSSSRAGAVYVYSRSNSIWSMDTYIKSHHTDNRKNFGGLVSMNSAGNSIAVYQPGFYSGGNNNISEIHVFDKTVNTWARTNIIQHPTQINGNAFSYFNFDSSGNKILASFDNDNSGSIRINGSIVNYEINRSGAAYLFVKEGNDWINEAFIKANSPGANDLFGRYMSISGDGNTFSITSVSEDSDATGINGDENNNDKNSSGSATIIEYCKD